MERSFIGQNVYFLFCFVFKFNTFEFHKQLINGQMKQNFHSIEFCVKSEPMYNNLGVVQLWRDKRFRKCKNVVVCQKRVIVVIFYGSFIESFVLYVYFRYLRSLVETILIYKHFTKPSIDPQAAKQELVDFWMDFMVESTQKDVTSVRFPVWILLTQRPLYCVVTFRLHVHQKTLILIEPFKTQKWRSCFHALFTCIERCSAKTREKSCF